MSDEPPYAIPIEETLDGVLGFEVVSTAPDHASGRFVVENHHRQAFGIVHGGVYSAFAEGLCSMATYLQVADAGKIVVGSSNHTSFLRPTTEGTVEIEARAVHRGRKSWVWECEFTNNSGKPCAITRVTLAVLER